MQSQCEKENYLDSVNCAESHTHKILWMFKNYEIDATISFSGVLLISLIDH